MLIYLTLALAIVLPGFVSSLGIVPVEMPLVGTALARLRLSMQSIAFGEGLRFWLGVTGATMMALLLLYPLRKLFGFAGWVSVRGWFHFHVVFGLLGPVLMLYHCDFGAGSTPANVGLFTALSVAASGLFGHYVYTRLSADFYGERRRAIELLETAIAEFNRLAPTPSRTRLVEDLRAYDADLIAARRGPAGWLGAAGGLKSTRRDLLARAVWLIDNQGPQEGWSLSECREVKGRVHRGLEAFFTGLGRSARRSSLERTAAIWRLLHMPLFFITAIAVSIHVYKVWGIDAVRNTLAVEVGRSGTNVPGREARPQPGNGPAGIADRGSRGASPSTAPPRDRDGGSAIGTARGTNPLPARKVTTERVPVNTERTLDRDGMAKATDTPVLLQGPRLARRPEAKGGADAQPAPTVQKQTRAVVESRPGTAAIPIETPAVAPAKPIVQAEADPAERLRQRLTPWDNSGRLDPQTISDRLAILRRDAAFSHDRTGFPLTGRHVGLACENCHKTTLKDTSHRCISCHRKNDIHRGRRPNCDNCHTTKSWGDFKTDR